MDKARRRPSKRNRRIRRQLGLGRTQDLSDSFDSDSETNKRVRRTYKVEKDATMNREGKFENYGRDLFQVRTRNISSSIHTGRRNIYSDRHLKSNVPGGINLREGHISAVQKHEIDVACHENSERHHIKVAGNCAPSSSTFECVPNNRSDTDSSVQPSACPRSTIKVEPQEASEGTSNDEVLPDSLSERARRCRSTGEAFSLPRYDQEHIDTIEAKTRGQGDNPLWFDYRIGCISASRFKRVATWKGRRYPNAIVKSIMKNTAPKRKQPNIVWGQTMEPVAKQKYVQLMKSEGHEEIQVKECGIFFHPKKTFIGASPDGLVSCKSGCKACKREDDRCGILEIKCPVKPSKIPAPQNTRYLTQSARGSIVLDERHKHYYQVQTQLAVTGLPWCDFFVYNHYGESFIRRIWPCPRQWELDAIKVEQFFWNYIVPELVGIKLENQMTLRAPRSRAIEFIDTNTDDER